MGQEVLATFQIGMTCLKWDDVVPIRSKLIDSHRRGRGTCPTPVMAVQEDKNTIEEECADERVPLVEPVRDWEDWMKPSSVTDDEAWLI